MLPMWGNSLTIQIVFMVCVEHCGAAVTLLMLTELTRLELALACLYKMKSCLQPLVLSIS